MPKKRRQTKSAKLTSNNNQVIQWIEAGVAVILLLILIILHFIVFLHSGGLWRDEVNTVNIANLPSVVDIGNKLQFDSFPILFFLLLRSWIFIGFGETDLALRALGLIIGLGTLGALWYTGRVLGTRLPFISLVLFAMISTVFVGDSLRAYGLGTMLILLSLGTMWRVIQDPKPWRMVVSAIAVILSVHSLYHNSFLIFAICTGAAAVGIYRHQWKLIIFPLGLGILTMISVFPYLGTVSSVRDYNIIRIIPMNLSWILDKFHQAISPSGTFITWIWFALALLVVIVFVRSLVISAPDQSREQKDLAVFLLTTMMISIIVYIAFIRILSLPTQSWYYLPLMAVLIVIIDKGVDLMSKIHPYGRMIRIICVLGITTFIFMDSWNAAYTRKTNIDVLAAKLESISNKDDFIIVNPFYYGVSFARYYKGSATWMTLPEIEDNSLTRYDLLKIKMTQNEPIKTILRKMNKTLQDGQRVWLVGGFNFLPDGERPGMLPPAPNSPYGWSEEVYQIVWSDTTTFTLQTHGQTFKEISISTVDQVNKFENVSLMVVQGWRP